MDWRDESLALLPADVPDERIAELGLNLLRGDLLLPALVLKESALAAQHRPHGRLLSRIPAVACSSRKSHDGSQDHPAPGGCGCMGHLCRHDEPGRTLREVGLGRLFLVNELVEPTAVNWVVAELAGDSQFEFFCLVDSMAGVELLSDLLASAGATRPLPVLIEIGVAGGRAGCRTLEEAQQVAASVAASPICVWWGLRVLSRLLNTLTLPMSLRPSMVFCL